MAASVLVDAAFLVALLNRRDANHSWATAQAAQRLPPWKTCEAALSEAFHLLGPNGTSALSTLMRRNAVQCTFSLSENFEAVLALMLKYADVPMSLADACLVRMSEIAGNSVLLTTDADFRVYRRHSRQSIPYVLPK